MLYQLIALDWDNHTIDKEVTEERQQKITNYWKGAFGRWAHLATNECFWDKLTTRIGNGVVYPIHLLYATLLAEDEHRDATLAELNIERKRLLRVAKREVLMPQVGAVSGSKKERARWN